MKRRRMRKQRKRRIRRNMMQRAIQCTNFHLFLQYWAYEAIRGCWWDWVQYLGLMVLRMLGWKMAKTLYHGNVLSLQNMPNVSN